jgi:altronate dehydratase
VNAALSDFQAFLIAIGTPGFPALVAGTGAADLSAYGSAYADGIRVALLTSGVGAVVGAIIAGIALGPRDPLQTVWEHRDERRAPGASATTAAPPS